ncbi:TIGR02300 family protein [Roseobacteraceae bacterium S113]
MPKPEWGTKRLCPTTGKRFYDLNADPIVSPYTGETVAFDQTKTRMIAADAEDAATTKLKAADEEEVVLEDDEDVDVDLGDDVLDDDDDDDNVSLDEIADVAAEDDEG